LRRVTVTVFDHGEAINLSPRIEYGNPDGMVLFDETAEYLTIDVQFAKSEPAGKLAKEISFKLADDERTAIIQQYLKEVAGYRVVDKKGRPVGELIGFYVDHVPVVERTETQIRIWNNDIFNTSNNRRTRALDTSRMGTSIGLVFGGKWKDLYDLSFQTPDGAAEPLVGDFLPPEYRCLALSDDQVNRLRRIVRQRAALYRQLQKKWKFAKEHKQSDREAEIQKDFDGRIELETAAYDAILTDAQKLVVEGIRKQQAAAAAKKQNG
jgi:hypothetical protein